MPSLYEITVPVFIRQLHILASLLEQGVAHVGNDKLATM